MFDRQTPLRVRRARTQRFVLRVVAFNLLSAPLLSDSEASRPRRSKKALLDETSMRPSVEHDSCSFHVSARSPPRGQVPVHRHYVLQQVRRCLNSLEQTEAASQARDAAESLQERVGAMRVQRGQNDITFIVMSWPPSSPGRTTRHSTPHMYEMAHWRRETLERTPQRSTPHITENLQTE